MNKINDEKVLVVDFGSQTTQLIIRKVREAGYRCEMIDYNKLPKHFKKKPPLLFCLVGRPHHLKNRLKSILKYLI